MLSRVFTLFIIIIIFFFRCERKLSTNISDIIEYECANDISDSISYVDTLYCPDEYKALASIPLSQTSGKIACIKVVYEIATGRLYFASSKKYYLHYDFCYEVLNYTKPHKVFNYEQYSDNDTRLYCLGTISYYEDSDVYTLEFFPDDKLSADQIELVYNKVCKTTYFGNQIYFLSNSTSIDFRIRSIRSGMRVIYQDEIFKGQTYQALNNGECYGYLKIIDISQLSSSVPGIHDIVLVNGIPNDIPVISGIVTTVFQSPLSHINVLSHNRGTPNMAYKNALADQQFTKRVGILVYLSVTPDSFVIRDAVLAEAEKFWKKNEPSIPQTMICNDTTQGLFELTSLSHQSIPLVGAKAANLGELTRISQPDSTLAFLPEGAFAIPFFYYRNHLKRNNIESFLNKIIDDSLSVVNIGRRKLLLDTLREKIITASIDPEFVKMVETKIRSSTIFRNIRFRSSTNAEDLEGFNGAGLYESYSAEMGNPKKTVGEAIKKVYASMWTLEGFQEREYFKIDQRSVAMGILVHRAFPDEIANGVAITKNIYEPLIPAYTISCQKGEISVVNPPHGTTCDQLLFHLMNETTAFKEPSMSYISYSNLNSKKGILNEQEIVRLAKYLKEIHDHFFFYVFKTGSYYHFAMDVEFKVVGPNRDIYIKQVRPY